MIDGETAQSSIFRDEPSVAVRCPSDNVLVNKSKSGGQQSGKFDRGGQAKVHNYFCPRSGEKRAVKLLLRRKTSTTNHYEAEQNKKYVKRESLHCSSSDTPCRCSTPLHAL